MKVSAFQPNFPFSPAKFPIFYGWVILVASVLGVMTSIPGQTIGCLLPFGGKLLDRWGMTIIVIASAIGPSLLSNSKAITGSYVAGLYACCLFAPIVIGLMVFVRSPTRRKLNL